jgi:ATP-dependent Clp protease protease subunit
MREGFNDWFKISMLGGKRASVSIHGVIGLPKWLQEYGYSAAGTFKEFETELRALGDDITEIELSVYSPGGSVFDALGIHNILSRHSARVTGVVDGIAASAAVSVLMAADTVYIPSNAYLMIHNAQGFEAGDHHAMAKMATDLEKWTNDIAKMYTAKITGNTGADFAKTLASIRDKMDAETWLNGDDAVGLGLADHVSEEVELAACIAPMPGLTNALPGVDPARIPEELRPLFDNRENLQTKNLMATNNKTATPAAPAAETPAAPATATPAAPANEAPATETPAAPAAEAPAAPATETPAAPAAAPSADDQPATLADLRNLINGAIAPIAEKVENLENLRAAGVKPGAWGTEPPANTTAGADEPEVINFEEKTPLQLVSLGRQQAQERLRKEKASA